MTEDDAIRLEGEIRARLWPVCSDMTDEMFDGLVAKVLGNERLAQVRSSDQWREAIFNPKRGL